MTRAMKPLHQLHTDRAACERIFSDVTGGELVSVFQEPDHIELYGVIETYGPGSIYIYFDEVYETPVGRPRVVKRVLKELGYATETEIT